jgi:hypothetical protein
MLHDAIGGYFSHELITLVNALSPAKPEGERDGVDVRRRP